MSPALSRLGGGAISFWRVMVEEEPSAAAQMARDEQLARSAHPTFRLFRWSKPALSLGFKQAPPEWARPAARLAAFGVEIVERPTGGGIAVHGSDLSCSIVVPHEACGSLHSLMQRACEGLSEGIRGLGIEATWSTDSRARSRIEYCLTEASPYALMIGERKLCGLAVRRYPASWLIQGSMLVRALPEAIDRVMPRAVSDAYRTRSVSVEDAVGHEIADEELTAVLIRAWQDTVEVHSPQTTVHRQAAGSRLHELEACSL